MSDDPITGLRREPPTFRRVTVTAVVDLSPHLRRITFQGEELEARVGHDIPMFDPPRWRPDRAAAPAIRMASRTPTPTVVPT